MVGTFGRLFEIIWLTILYSEINSGSSKSVPGPYFPVKIAPCAIFHCVQDAWWLHLLWWQQAFMTKDLFCKKNNTRWQFVKNIETIRRFPFSSLPLSPYPVSETGWLKTVDLLDFSEIKSIWRTSNIFLNSQISCGIGKSRPGSGIAGNCHIMSLSRLFYNSRPGSVFRNKTSKWLIHYDEGCPDKAK